MRPKSITRIDRNREVRGVFRHLVNTADTPFARSLDLNVDDHSLLGQLQLDPTSYQDRDVFRKDYLIVSYLSKWTGLSTGIDTEAVALRNFVSAEAICETTNRRLRHKRTTIVDSILHRAQREIARVLGPFDRSRLDGLERWGPGATLDLRRREAYLDTKFTKLPITVTADCLPLLREAIQNDLHWSYVILKDFPCGPYSLLSNVFEVVPGSRIVTVPKNAKTDRTIAIEPTGNMFLQKSVGNFIRSRLKRFGIDLDDQTRNQILAREGQEKSLATIDLSMASDTMSKLLIYELLPLEWALYLDRLRSKSYTLGRETKVFEKFSSMGNGFTFELESLLFYGLSRAAVESEDAPVAVYGDDIIVPSSDAWPLITALAYCGFSVNVDKTFIDGPFRESCGRHYFDGADVTPIYQKESLSDLQGHIRFVNRLARYAVKHNDGDKIDSWTGEIWAKLYGRVRHQWHPQLPFGAEGDDGYLISHVDNGPKRPYCRNRGYKWQVIVRQVSRIPAADEALLAYALRLGCKTEAPYMGSLPSNDDSAVTYARVARWIEPSWEFALST